MKKILIMGLPGSGKTTLAKKLKASLKADWLNADKVRKKYKDWDFSRKGVLKQAKRMKILAGKSKKKFVIADFICPFTKGQKIFNPDYLIWMDTIKRGRLSTFNKSFQKPKKYNFRITTKNSSKYSKIIVKYLKNY
jgi:deoxyadenosine/deoxycytidine kinase